MCAERKIAIFWVKKSWHFYISLSLLPSVFFILVQIFGARNLLGLMIISVGNLLGNSRHGIKRKKVQLGSGGFSSPFSAQRYLFFLSFYPGMV